MLLNAELDVAIDKGSELEILATSVAVGMYALEVNAVSSLLSGKADVDTVSVLEALAGVWAVTVLTIVGIMFNMI